MGGLGPPKSDNELKMQKGSRLVPAGHSWRNGNIQQFFNRLLWPKSALTGPKILRIVMSQIQKHERIAKRFGRIAEVREENQIIKPEPYTVL